ncbi:RidA family protein [Lacibacterium aquatile]|uniref:RidA family protein n=1 Tax=Lacibacterium aquatile TaxID=1168082 RepID=A0ABW5DZ29_9PROT
MSASANLAKHGIILPPPHAPIANFIGYRRVGNLLYISGQGPVEPNGKVHSGKVGGTVTVEEAYQHARIVGLNILALVNEALGSLDKVDYVVKLLGMVNGTPEFAEHPQVINGCSDLFIQVFGDEAGPHARSAVGMGSLPMQITVEIEAIFAVKE